MTAEVVIKSLRMASNDLIVMGAECINTGDRLVLRSTPQLIGEALEIGTTWLVVGVRGSQTLKREGFIFHEQVLELQECKMLLGSGEALVRLLSESKKFPGIGRVKAQRLWNEFGIELFDVIKACDYEKLERVLSPGVATFLCKGFSELSYIKALQDLMGSPLPSRVCLDLIKAYDKHALDRVLEDPYRLLCFLPDWKKVDRIAQVDFNVSDDDDRRLRAAVSEALMNRFGLGDTAAHASQIASYVGSLLGNAKLTSRAMKMDGSTLYKTSESLIHPVGPWLMEQVIAKRILDSQKAGSLSGLDNNLIASAIDVYEAKNNISLTLEQREAIILTAGESISLILGGAGCGKTTVLKGVYEVLNSTLPGLRVHQIALSGRAAQRMQESTGLEARTIAAFLRDGGEAAGQLTSNDVVVVDEASMLDIITSYRLFRKIPKEVKIILVGDPEQLPPVGPGLLLHVLADGDVVPRTTLKVVKRQAGDSGIVAVACAIRDQRLPSFEHADITFTECKASALTDKVVDQYFQHGGTGENFNTVIVCPTKQGAGSTSQINAGIVERLDRSRPRVKTIWLSSDGFQYVDHTVNGVPLSVGDLVLITKNDYEIEVRNGSLGKVVSIPESLPENFDDVACFVDVDDLGIVGISVSKLEILEHGYAITTHKAQGSEFPVVIFPVRRSRLLDKSLAYTAITRARKECHIIGDRVVFDHAVTSPPSSSRRTVGLMAAFQSLTVVE